MTNRKNETARAYKTARTVCVFCAGFCCAGAIVAALYHDLPSFLAAAGITLILMLTKKIILEE